VTIEALNGPVATPSTSESGDADRILQGQRQIRLMSDIQPTALEPRWCSTTSTTRGHLHVAADGSGHNDYRLTHYHYSNQLPERGPHAER
jgi:hypothetical protein